MVKKNKKNKGKVQKASENEEEKQQETDLQSLEESVKLESSEKKQQEIIPETISAIGGSASKSYSSLTPGTSSAEIPPTQSLQKLSFLSQETDTSEQSSQGSSSETSSSQNTPIQGLAKTSKETREITKEQRRNQPQTRFGTSCEPGNVTHELAIPKRGGPGNIGKEGKKYLVHVNHFPLKISDQKRINHYDLEITTPWKRLNRRSDEPLFRRGFRKLCQENANIFPNYIAFDGIKSIYTTRKLGYSKESWTGKVEIPDSLEVSKMVVLSFKVQLARTNIDLAGAVNTFIAGQTPNAYSEVQILNIVLSQVAREKCVTIGRNYFPESSIQGRSVDLTGGKSVWFGFFQSVNIGWKPMLNVDVANKPAVKGGNMIDYMEEVLAGPARGREPPIKPNFRDQGGRFWDSRKASRHVLILEKDLKGLKVRYIRPDKQKREWRCNKVMDPAKSLVMEHKGKKITIEDYFRIEYKHRLQFPHLPCLHLGSVQKNYYIPAELCEMKTQPLPQSKKLGEDETAQMIKTTAVTPYDRKKRIEDNLRDISNTFQNDQYAKEFGLSVESVMSQIPARVYDPPALAYKDLNNKKDNKPVKFEITQPGKWDMLRGPRGSKLSFIDNKHLTKWAILDLANTSPQDIDNFVDSLYKEGDKIGYHVEFHREVARADMYNMNNVFKEFQRLCSLDLQMILIITRGKNASIYNGLKHEGDVISKISTQFVQQKNIGNQRFPPKPATLHNILLKINSKLGGTNQILDSSISPKIFSSPVMIMGADVTHPASDFKGEKPSIAAVVGSMDPKASQYKCEIRFQDTAQNEEMILSMEEVTNKLLREFRNRTKREPSRLIFYRDGVSEGQFLTVLNKELAAIRRACSSLNENYKPAITFVVAQKRHKTRLFPVNPPTGRNQNVPPGTAVDHTITHPTEFSFFLASHEGIQGTTKPTSYHLLWDDANMTPDDLIKMTYYLCHVYARCERSVSYPAPTYYAHLAAFRARVHHDALVDTNRDTKDNRARLEEEISLANYFM
eukprot:GFUD01005419.1.p1 GENE.GFUD01005419.1~~GFUD01005419.1.p1  ORF type:complete len:1029 (+),score=236.79 GFUD01005419.1:45-3089(+)